MPTSKTLTVAPRILGIQGGQRNGESLGGGEGHGQPAPAGLHQGTTAEALPFPAGPRRPAPCPAPSRPLQL